MFRVYFTNFDYYSQNDAQTLTEAQNIARKAGFQCRIEDVQGNPVCSYCPLGGWKYYVVF